MCMRCPKLSRTELGCRERARHYPMSAIFRVKPLARLIADSERSGQQLKRTLGPLQLTSLGIGAIIGAGLFSTVGTAAAGGADHLGAGPAIVLSFVLTAVACGLAALCYAEFAAMVPVSGIGLHLRLRDARRAGGVDHRLGSDHRVRDRQRRRRHLVVRLLPGAAARLRPASAGLARHRLPDRLPGGGRRGRGGGGEPARRRQRRRAARRVGAAAGAARLRHPDHLQPAGVPDRRADHRGARPRRLARAPGSTPRWSC